jgi:hypothetical protein
MAKKPQNGQKLAKHQGVHLKFLAILASLEKIVTEWQVIHVLWGSFMPGIQW